MKAETPELMEIDKLLIGLLRYSRHQEFSEWHLYLWLRENGHTEDLTGYFEVLVQRRILERIPEGIENRYRKLINEVSSALWLHRVVPSDKERGMLESLAHDFDNFLITRGIRRPLEEV